MRTGKELIYVWPSRVPECGGDGRIERVPGQAAWRCVNRNSFAILRREFHNFAGKHALDIEGLGKKTVDQLMGAGLIAVFDDIFSLKEEDLRGLDGFADISAKKLVASIRRGRDTELSRLLVGLSIPHVGEETAVLLAERFRTMGDIAAASEEELNSISGIGDIVAQSITNWFHAKQHAQLVARLSRIMTVSNSLYRKEKKASPRSLEGKTFVLTGTLASLSRDEAKNLIRGLGGAVSSSVSARTSYVIAGEQPGSKYQEAQRLRIPVLSEDAFLKLVKR